MKSIQKAELFVIGTQDDPHIDAILNPLKEDLAICRLNVDQFPVKTSVTVSISAGTSTLIVENETGCWDVSTPKVAWFRRFGWPIVDSELEERYASFAED